MLLGIDIGTSSVKALLFDSDTASVVATASAEYPTHHPRPDRAEQHPDDWWRAAVSAVREALAAAGRADVAAIGLCGLMHGVSLLAAGGTPVHPSIIWADQRSAAESGALIEAVGVDRFTRIAGTLPAAGFMASTLAWLRKYDPQSLERARHVVLPKDYVRLKLTGEIGTDVSDAAATGLFDIVNRTWSETLVDAVGAPPELFPTAYDSAAVTGALIPSAAAALGLRVGIPVVAGCADQPAQALGNGLIAPGKASVTIGSGGQVFTPIQPDSDGTLKTDPRLHVFNHAVPGMYYILGAILSAGLSLRWLRGVTGLEGRAAYDLMSAEAARVAPGADGLIFLPYLSGERTPHMDPLARGGFIGLTHYHARGHLARAIMEGVAFAMRDALSISLELGGQVEMVIAVGGGAESDVWRQILADVFGVPLRKSLLSELTGVGAALLAGVGSGVYDSLDSACAQTARYGAPIEPDAERQATYDALYAQYQALYPRLRDSFHWLSRFGG